MRIILALALILTPALACGQTTTGSFTGYIGPPISPYLVYDTFTGGDASLDAHTPDVTPGGGWVEARGNWVISGGKANSGQLEGIAVIESGVSDVSVSVIGTLQGTDINCGSPMIVLRETAAKDCWHVGALAPNANLNAILENNNDSYTTRASTACVLSDNGEYTITATAASTTITGLINGACSASYGSATFNQTATKHGMRMRQSFEPPDTPVFDDFIIWR